MAMEGGVYYGRCDPSTVCCFCASNLSEFVRILRHKTHLHQNHHTKSSWRRNDTNSDEESKNSTLATFTTMCSITAPWMYKQLLSFISRGFPTFSGICVSIVNSWFSFTFDGNSLLCSIFLFYFRVSHPMYFIMISFLCLFLFHSTSGTPLGDGYSMATCSPPQFLHLWYVCMYICTPSSLAPPNRPPIPTQPSAVVGNFHSFWK